MMTPTEAADAIEEGRTEGVAAAVAGFSKQDQFEMALAAVELGHGSLFEEMLALGLDPSYAPSSTTLLSAAAARNQLEIVRQLLAQGIHPDSGRALVDSAMAGHLEAIRLLLEAGADPNQGVPGFPTALGFAEQFGHTDVAALLREWGASGLLAAQPVDEGAPPRAAGDVAAALEALLGGASRAPLELGGTPGLAIHTVERDGEVALYTVGASTSSVARGRSAELVLRLPADWDLDAALSPAGDARWRWPIDELVRVARGAQGGAPLSEGDTVTDPAGPAPLHASTALGGWLLLPAMNPVGDVCVLDAPGEPVHVLAMIAIHQSELAYMRERGLVPLLKEPGWGQIATVVDPDRLPVV